MPRTARTAKEKGPSLNPATTPPAALNFDTMKPTCLMLLPCNGAPTSTTRPRRLGRNAENGRSTTCQLLASSTGTSGLAGVV